MSEVFISYKANDVALGNNDADIAKELCHELEKAGISCWMAPRDIQPGARYAQAIMRAINNCRVMLLVFSRYANHSPTRLTKRLAAKKTSSRSISIRRSPMKNWITICVASNGSMLQAITGQESMNWFRFCGISWVVMRPTPMR